MEEQSNYLSNTKWSVLKLYTARKIVKTEKVVSMYLRKSNEEFMEDSGRKKGEKMICNCILISKIYFKENYVNHLGIFKQTNFKIFLIHF